MAFCLVTCDFSDTLYTTAKSRVENKGMPLLPTATHQHSAQYTTLLCRDLAIRTFKPVAIRPRPIATVQIITVIIFRVFYVIIGACSIRRRTVQL